MKATKYLVMAAAALAFAACSNEELASVAPKNKSGLKPLEFSTIVQKQTRSQIDASNLTTLYMTTTGTFYDANDVLVTNPTLTLTKDGDNWTYTYNGNSGDLYWPSEGTNATFKAWYYDGGSAAGALNNKNADKDAVGAYAAINYVEGEQTVSLSTYHAVAKADFKVKVLAKEQGNNKVKIDVKSVCLHNMNYKASAYTAPTSEAQMGAFTVDGTTHRDLITPIGDSYTPSFITEGTDAVSKGSLFVLPQTFTVQDLTETSWTKPYISVLAQICIDKDGDSDPIIFPKNGTATDYAWIALPLPSEFTGMVAHKKYVFTINFRNDALGKVDRDQNPNGEDKNGNGEEPNEEGDDDDKQPSGPNTNDNVPDGDEGSDIKLGNHSGYALKVTVTTVDDFGEGGEYDVTNTASGGGGSSYSGALSGEFSISDTKKINFSSGNLQATWNGTSWNWHFAEHQWDFIGGIPDSNSGNAQEVTGNNLINGDGTVSAANVTVDLFGWVGASNNTWTGAAMYGITNSTTILNVSGYGNNQNESLKSDWGNTMSPEWSTLTGASQTEWRTLTMEEWVYILTRSSGSTVNGTENANYTLATINTDVNSGVNGMILFPNDVTIAAGEATSWGDINNNSAWGTKCTSAQWTALAAKGCVFLPAAGTRYRADVEGTKDINEWDTAAGYYWSSTPHIHYYNPSMANNAYHMNFCPQWISYDYYPGYGADDSNTGRPHGESVRLVREVPTN